MTAEFVVVTEADAVAACFPVLQQLRTHVPDAERFTAQVGIVHPTSQHCRSKTVSFGQYLAASAKERVVADSAPELDWQQPSIHATTAPQVERQRQDGYRLACLREVDGGAVVSVAGFRVFETFFDGKVVIVTTNAHEMWHEQRAWLSLTAVRLSLRLTPNPTGNTRVHGGNRGPLMMLQRIRLASTGVPRG